MYSSGEYFLTLDFTTVNKPLWKQVFNKDEHHKLRKELGVTYAAYSSNRNDANSLSVVFKHDTKDTMDKQSAKISSLIEENKEKWSQLGDLDSIQFTSWHILCERVNDMRFERILNKSDDVFWVARHGVEDKQQWVKAMRTQQDAGLSYDVRWWGLMENVNDENEVCCIYRLARDRVQDFVMNFAESLPMMKQTAGIDVNSCNVKFVNVEWETMYNHPATLKKMMNADANKVNDEESIRKVIKEVSNSVGNERTGRNHMRDDCVFIRPSGNPLNLQQWDKMMESPDVNSKFSKLLSVDKVVVDGNMAYAVYTTHSQFNYKGIENDDVAVFTGVFQKENEQWKLVHGQRSTGRPPSAKELAIH